MTLLDTQKWMKLLVTAAFALTSAVAFSAVAGCEEDVDSASDVGREMDEAADDAGDAMEDAADDTEDAVDDAADDMDNDVDLDVDN